MTNLANLTTSQLKSIIAIKEQIEALQGQIDSIADGGGEIPIPFTDGTPKKRRMSRAGRAAIAAGQRARWAKVKETKSSDAKPAKKGKHRMSAAGRAAIRAAVNARWAKARAARKTKL